MAKACCAHCATVFFTQTAHRYCSARCHRKARSEASRVANDDRLRLLEAAHADEPLPATRIDLRDVDPCYYCGLPADTVDHVIPQCSLGDLEALGIAQLGSKRTWTVPACRECNCALQNRILRTVSHRKAWVKKWLRRRYAKYLRTPQWTDDELMELGYALRQNVQDHIDAKRTLLLRLKW